MDLFDFRLNFDSDWYVHLVCPQNGALELGIIDRNYDLVPKHYDGPANGLYLTFIVDDVETVLLRANELGFPILQEPRPTFYGQHRMLLSDPDGTLIDVSSLLPDNDQ